MSVRGTSDGVVAVKTTESTPLTDADAVAVCSVAVSGPIPRPGVHCTFARPSESVVPVEDEQGETWLGPRPFGKHTSYKSAGGLTMPLESTDHSTVTPGKPLPDASATLTMRESERGLPRRPTCPSPETLRRLPSTTSISVPPVGDSPPHAAARRGNAQHQSNARCLA